MVMFSLQFEQNFFNKLNQMLNLLKLAARILIDLAITGEDVQLF